MEHHGQQSHGQAAKTDTQNAQHREIIAYFSNVNQAQQAANSISSHVRSVHVDEVPAERLREGLHSAKEGISVVEIGIPAWLGLALGLMAGAILGTLVYSNEIALPGIASALSAGHVAVSFLLAGVLGSIGWLIGALVSLLRISTKKTVPEVRTVISENNRPEVEKMLLSAGALDVLAANGAEHA